MLYDKDIREPLFGFLEETYGKTRIIEEKMMGRSRADAIMVTGHELWGIEIKSDADTYARLSRQIKDYCRYFDRNIIVAGTSHAQHVSEHVPADWGIITAEETENGPDFYIYRQPAPNPMLERLMKIRILWRPELDHILELNALPAYRQKSKDFVRQALVERVEPDLLDRQISDELFERDYQAIAETINAYRAAHGQRRRRNTARRKRKSI